MDLENRKRKFHGFEGLKDKYDELLRDRGLSYSSAFREPLENAGPSPIQSQIHLDI